MSERLFHRLVERLRTGPVVLASVIDTRGATPRKGGSRMLVFDSGCEFSVGGGLAEARVVDAARALLRGQTPRSQLQIDLSGKPGAVGVCGGSMHVSLRRWQGEQDFLRAMGIANDLQAGRCVTLSADDLGADDTQASVAPDARLLIVGGGHCALALHDLARHLDFEMWVFDERTEYLASLQFDGANRLSGSFEQLKMAQDTGRDCFVVLLNRDYASDVAALRVVCQRPPAFLGMMGSRRRIAEVLLALPEHASALQALQAPVGLDINAQTPHEIAVSILAQLVQVRGHRQSLQR